MVTITFLLFCRVNLEEYRGKIHPLPTPQAYVQLPSNGTNSTRASGGISASSPSGFPFYLSTEVCIYIFSGLTVGTVIVTLFRSYYFFFMCMRASMRLHDHMFNSITRATMRFFNTNSSGNYSFVYISYIKKFNFYKLANSIQIFWVLTI